MSAASLFDGFEDFEAFEVAPAGATDATDATDATGAEGAAASAPVAAGARDRVAAEALATRKTVGRGVGAPSAPLRAGDLDRAAGTTSNHFQTPENPEFANTPSDEREGPEIASETSNDKLIVEDASTQSGYRKQRDRGISASEAHLASEKPEKTGEGYVVRTTVPVLPSQLDPSKRTPNYKEPTPESEWKPWWKPRKRPYGTARGWQAQQTAVAAVEEALGMEKGALDTLPRDEDGVPILGEEFADALVAFTAQGGTLTRFATATGVTRTRLWKFIKEPGVKERYEQARQVGIDAIAEEALQIASEPVYLEDTYESYDGNGNLVRRDVKTGDAAYARKLAFTARLELLKRWAPERYGDKVEVQTTDSMASKILAARKRIMR